MEWIVFWLIINCVVGYLIGRQKNNEANAVALAIFLGPISWLIAALSHGDLRKCPHCAEFVKPEAVTCRYCGKELPTIRTSLQAGQSLQYRYRDGYQALVLYGGRDYLVRISSTNLQ